MSASLTGVNTWTEELESMYGLIHPDDRAESVRQVEHALATFVPVEAEWRVLWPDRTCAGRSDA